MGALFLGSLLLWCPWLPLSLPFPTNWRVSVLVSKAVICKFIGFFKFFSLWLGICYLKTEFCNGLCSSRRIQQHMMCGGSAHHCEVGFGGCHSPPGHFPPRCVIRCKPHPHTTLAMPLLTYLESIICILSLLLFAAHEFVSENKVLISCLMTSVPA